MEKGKPLVILTVAVIILAALSLFGWEDLSGGYFKSFDLLSELKESNSGTAHHGNTFIDPDLLALENNDRYEYLEETNPVKDEVFVEENLTVEPVSETHEEAEEDLNQGEIKEPSHEVIETTHDEVIKETTPLTSSSLIDYSEGANIERLRKILNRTNNNLVRVAVLGDSYIEGDIFTQGLRQSLQDIYGGQGIGYTPIYSEIPGFRRSVGHSCQNFELLDFRKRSQNPFCLLQGVAFRAEDGAASTFTGINKYPHTDKWFRSRVLLTAPNGGQLKLKTGKDKPWETYMFSPSDSLHCVTLEGETDRLSIGSVSPGIIIQGVYLDDKHGIAVDNMSIRGYSGIRHDEINSSLIEKSKKFIDYDFIILEFGTNAVSSAQSDYSAYGAQMVKVIEKLKKEYPHAVIMVMGIGDRGEKRGAEFHSMSTIASMVETQRKIARATGSLFWDTRTAMGGEDSVIDWVKARDINKDYIHLSFNGGDRLSKLFVNDLLEVLR